MRTLAACLVAFVLTLAARAQQEEPWLKAGDVVALVGGEDMVALAEEGWLETLVTWAQPADRIRFRSLAWEGDTVFQQRRDLNYPTLEAQLDRMGATVVICQFGKMESFAGKEGVAAFTEAYEKLIARLSGEKKRRIALVLPLYFGHIESNLSSRVPDLTDRNPELVSYRKAVCTLASKHTARVLDPEPDPNSMIVLGSGQEASHFTRDGVHPSPTYGVWIGSGLARELGTVFSRDDELSNAPRFTKKNEVIRVAIQAKNRLWFHYTRPQNWAFLAGNRTNQPSSRDHLDPTRRWFPEEMEQWVPLIEAKEQEIWKLAAVPR